MLIFVNIDGLRIPGSGACAGRRRVWRAGAAPVCVGGRRPRPARPAPAAGTRRAQHPVLGSRRRSLE